MAHKKYPNKWDMREADFQQWDTERRWSQPYAVGDDGRYSMTTWFEETGKKSVKELFELIHK